MFKLKNEINNGLLTSYVSHYLINSSITIIVIFFYNTFGFYGWTHLFSLVFLHFSINTLDSYIEYRQKFPWYLIPLLAFSAFFYPLVTILAVVGILISNLRIILKSHRFVYERLEGMGMLLIGVFPYVLPLNIIDPRAFVAPFFCLMGIDSFHKIGHHETVNERWMWISGLTFMILVLVLYARTAQDIGIFLTVAVIPTAGFKLLAKKPRKYSWIYYQIWQTVIIMTLFARYPYFLQHKLYE